MYSTKILENVTGTKLTTLGIQATDPDANDRLTYSIEGGTGTFSIQSSSINSAVITVQKELDYEAQLF